MWDFSKAGLSDGTKEFFVSLLKTALAAGASYVLLRLGNIHLDIRAHNFELYTGILVVGRALVSSFLTWVNTYATDVAAVVTTEPNPSGL